MQIVKFSQRIVFATSAAFVALFMALTAPNSSAGLFDVPSEPADWNGPYVGFHAGVAISHYDISGYNTTVDLTRQYNIATAVSSPNGTTVPNGSTQVNMTTFGEDGHSSDDANGIGGVDLGYNKQIGHFVIGGGFGFSGTETDDASEARDFQANVVVNTPGQTTLDTPPVVNTPALTPGVARTDFHSFRRVEQIWSGYAGGQVGLAFNRWLIYGTGGAAFAQIDLRSFDRALTTFFDVTGAPIAPTSPGSNPTTDRHLVPFNTIQTGWYGGAGFQFALTDAVTLGLEYRHSDFGETVYHTPRSTKGPVFPGGTAIDADNDEILFKVSILLGHLGEKKVVQTPMGKK